MFGVVLGVVFGFPLGYLLGVRGLLLVPFALLAGILFGVFIQRFTNRVTEGTANAVLSIVWPSGNSTPYAKTYSAEQALAVRGDHAGALEAYEAAMRLNPTDPEPRIQAAEMLFRGPTPERAVTLFLEARTLAGADRARELYATQRLIDLYLGPARNASRALVELRRLVERFPGTREAMAAREVIGRLKVTRES
ncbi:hypothetical protein GPROT1_00186 [Gammaproteobacteria bacterium]|nr:hypothetical protein GPROT1_00186 [Gammaproteobacteria bacterium]